MKRALSKKELGGIVAGIYLGQRIQQDFPDVATKYLAGAKQEEIIQQEKMAKFYRIDDPAVLLCGFHYSLYGNSEFQGVPKYSGLATLNQLKARQQQGRFRSAQKLGLKMLEEGKGVHALGANKHKENGRKSAKARGETPWWKPNLESLAQKNFPSEEEFLTYLVNSPSYQTKTPYGVKLKLNEITHELNRAYAGIREDRTFQSVNAKIMSLGLKRNGYTRWTKEETAYLQERATEERFQHRHGQPDWKKICKEINDKFHSSKQVRNPSSAKNKLHEIKIK